MSSNLPKKIFDVCTSFMYLLCTIKHNFHVLFAGKILLTLINHMRKKHKVKNIIPDMNHNSLIDNNMEHGILNPEIVAKNIERLFRFIHWKLPKNRMVSQELLLKTLKFFSWSLVLVKILSTKDVASPVRSHQIWLLKWPKRHQRSCSGSSQRSC